MSKFKPHFRDQTKNRALELQKKAMMKNLPNCSVCHSNKVSEEGEVCTRCKEKEARNRVRELARKNNPKLGMFA